MTPANQVLFSFSLQIQKADVKEGKHRKSFHFYFDGMSPDFCDNSFGNAAENE